MDTLGKRNCSRKKAKSHSVRLHHSGRYNRNKGRHGPIPFLKDGSSTHSRNRSVSDLSVELIKYEPCIKWDDVWRKLDAHEELDFSRKDRGKQRGVGKSSRSKSHDYSDIRTIGKHTLKPDMLQALKRQNSLRRSILSRVDDPLYFGPHLDRIDFEHVSGVIEYFRKMVEIDIDYDKLSLASDAKPRSASLFSNETQLIHDSVPLHKQYVLDLIDRMCTELEQLSNVVNIAVPGNGKLFIVGDIHGQLRDLLLILDTYGFPSESRHYLFNGDFVDRGANSGEVIITLYCLKLLYPKFIHLNRGNHEARDVNSRDGFQYEVVFKWDMEVFDAFQRSFALLPICFVVNQDVLVVHGGLSWHDITLQDINALDRNMDNPEIGSTLEDLLWSDPSDVNGRGYSDRGVGCLFGRDVLEHFLSVNNLKFIVRSHECMDFGYLNHFEGLCHTVFSASNYCDVMDNQGAVLIFESSTFPEFSVETYLSSNTDLSNEATPDHFESPDKKLIVMHDVLYRLIDIITREREALKKYFGEIEYQPNMVSRDQWIKGMRTVLKLDIPWKDLIPMLEGCKIGFVTSEALDYTKFLSVYSPLIRMGRFLSEHASTSESLSSECFDFEESTQQNNIEDKEVTSVELEIVMDLLYPLRLRLELSMHVLDAEESGVLSLTQFSDACMALCDPEMSKERFEDILLALLTKYSCVDPEDDLILYEDFFYDLDEALS